MWGREREHRWRRQQHQQQQGEPWGLQHPQPWGLQQQQQEGEQAQLQQSWGLQQPQPWGLQQQGEQAQPWHHYGVPYVPHRSPAREAESYQHWPIGQQAAGPQHVHHLLQTASLHSRPWTYPQTDFTQQSWVQGTSGPPRKKIRQLDQGFEHKERRDSRRHIPCRYFHSPGGCRMGSQCSFHHGSRSIAEERGQERMAEGASGKFEGTGSATVAMKPSLPVPTEEWKRTKIEKAGETMDAILPPVHHEFQSETAEVDIAHDVEPPNLFAMAWRSISEDTKNALVKFAKEKPDLPMFESKFPPNRQIALFHDKPSLLMHGLNESLGQESQEVLELTKGARNVLLLGTSGCGKTRCLYELLAKHFGLYLVAGTMGNAGSADVETFLINRGLEYLNELKIEDPMEREYFIKNLTRLLLLARLGILKFCLEQNRHFSPFQWLLCQLGYATGRVDIFTCLCKKMKQLWVPGQNLFEQLDMTAQDVASKIGSSEMFLTVFDEAQVMFHRGQNMFPSYLTPKEGTRTFFSPVFKTLQDDHSLEGCVITSGTGLGLRKEMEALLSGIGRPDREPRVFTNFLGWQSPEQVSNYLRRFMDISVEDCADLFETFRGRYRPLVSCVEEVLRGKTMHEAKRCARMFLTKSKEYGSFYNAFMRLADHTRASNVKGVHVVAMLTSVLFHFLYTGGLPYVVRNELEMAVIECGIGRIVQLNEDSPLFQEPSLLLIRGFSDTGMVHVCIDEPLAIEALKNFCIDEGLLEHQWHDALRSVPSKSSRGFAWEKYVKSDFEKMFDGCLPLCKHPLFQCLSIKHSLFQQPANLMRPSEKAGILAEVMVSTDRYSLDDYLSSDPEKSPPFFQCDNHAGPDVCLRVRFADGSIVPCFVQLRLRGDVTHQEQVVETTNPHMFYTFINKKGERVVRGNRRTDRGNILQACKNGFLRFVIMYPAKIRGITSAEIDTDGEIGPQLRVVVGAQNADSFLDAEHIMFLNNLSYD